MSTHTGQDLADVTAALTGPGGPFELTEEPVLGVPTPVFRNRARSLADVLTASGTVTGADYLVTDTRRIGFAEHADAVAALATALREDYGIGKGDRVAIFAKNCPEWIIAFWATVSIGAVAAGFNAWWSRREVGFALRHCAPSLVFADAERAADHRGPTAAETIPVLGIETDLPALVAAHEGAPLPCRDIAEDDPATILYTSGTSGTPKGVVHSHRNLCAVIEYHRFTDAVAAALGAAPAARRYLLTSPLFHIASLHNLAVPRLATGSTVVLHRGTFDAERVLRLIERERVTNWGAVPTMAARLLEHGNLDGYDLSSLTSFALASAPSSARFKDRLRAALPSVAATLVDSYGLTESSTGVTVASPRDLAESPGTLGRPVIGMELEIRDERDRRLPEDTEGEICVRGQYVMVGYWNDTAATSAALDAERWLRTGDIGVVSGGRLRLTARRSDLIIRGGENVYPAEVEAVIAEHPAVRECVVLGADDPEYGQRVVAVVVTREETGQVNQRQLHDFTSANLAYYKVPSVWRFTKKPLPRNATGKVIRAAVPH
ncbi:fatty acid--CoA ligase [Prauserella marina]|uniref:Acyl-CoA synthetase (AMP-forming)/AMP-acid ligase II n=1 Tax=Prauserella marina TaxID=530584 RepID=A0A222VS87_9PSEU|nr:class I adenylate-forming enzyme family protein [Prauserella marina]ASR36769.1 fatty acid--CoA ligase [Prauserella marina]PWV80336.1 acyl-CoA synthetase (AMP-forming)/AMP-acid ligase II [Prauserella marina]SDD52049.1 Acyl-CoA synthetase (AMP-forming)/AMP-acid ligase II [Prauserella marina]